MAGDIVVQYEPTPDNPRNSEGAFITLRRPDGKTRIMFAYTRFTGGRDDAATADIAAIYSDDGGKTWTDPKIIVPNRGEVNTMSVSLLRMNDGRILFSYLTKDGIHGWPHGNCRPWVCFSSDEGATWTEPKLITQVPGYYVQNNDRIIQLSDSHPVAPGRLIAPQSFHRLTGYEPETEKFHFTSSIVIWTISDDGGETWHEAKTWWAIPVPSGSGIQEPGVIERPNGKLYGWARTDTGYQWTTESGDGGENWAPFQPERKFMSPNSPLCMKRIPGTDRLLVIWNDRSDRWDIGTPDKWSWERTPLASAISDDNAATWTNHHLVEDDPTHGYCYTAIHFLSADEAHDSEPYVLLAYCAGGEDTKGVLNRLRMRRIPLSWFTAE